MASALLDSLIASGGYHLLPMISETNARMTMKFLPDFKLNNEARYQKITRLRQIYWVMSCHQYLDTDHVSSLCHKGHFTWTRPGCNSTKI